MASSCTRRAQRTDQAVRPEASVEGDCVRRDARARLVGATPWHCWQIRRVERSLWRYAATHHATSDLWSAFGAWVGAVDDVALTRRLSLLARTSACVGAWRRGWHGLAESVSTARAQRARGLLALRIGLRRAKEAITRWRLRCGYAASPLWGRVRRAYGLARQLLFLFAWRFWVDATRGRRDDELLSGTLPLVHGFQRWRARSEGSGLHLLQRLERLGLKGDAPRMRQLPAAWRTWPCRTKDGKERAASAVASSLRRALSAKLLVRLQTAATQRTAHTVRPPPLLLHAAAGALLHWRRRLEGGPTRDDRGRGRRRAARCAADGLACAAAGRGGARRDGTTGAHSVRLTLEVERGCGLTTYCARRPSVRHKLPRVGGSRRLARARRVQRPAATRTPC